MSDNQPVTREEVQQIVQSSEARLREELQVVVRVSEARLRDELQEVVRTSEARLSEQIRDVQTELLKAFLPWQENVRIQFRELEVNTGNSVNAVKERMGILERRLSEIEKRLLMNPPAA
jgi:hypothetical protein